MSNLSTNTAKQFNYVGQFKCAADKCTDTCCSGWKVAIEDSTKTLYAEKAPELLDYVLIDENGANMKLNDKVCSQLTDGLCHIHANYGEEFLSETCSFFPRKVIQVGQTRLMSAEASCPEIARIIMTNESPFSLVPASLSRVPSDLPQGFVDAEREKKSFFVMQRFMTEIERVDLTAEDILTRFVLVATQLGQIDQAFWAVALDDLLDSPYCGLDIPSSRLISHHQLINDIAQLCSDGSAKWIVMLENIKTIFDTNGAAPVIKTNLIAARKNNYDTAKKFDQALKRFIGSELIRRVFPYGSEKSTDQSKAGVVDKIMPIVVFFCFFRTALLAYIDHEGNPPSNEKIIAIFQTLSREINHLLTPAGDFFKAKGLSNSPVLLQLINNLE